MFWCCLGRYSLLVQFVLHLTFFFLSLISSQTMITGLQEIDKLKAQVQDIHVPLEVFDYIDQGRNPQLYTKDCIEKALTKNEQVKGKIDAYRKFKAHMLVELTNAFPTELAKYRAIRGGDETPPSF